MTIDLNGYTIDRNLNEQQDNVFSVIAGGTLIIKDTVKDKMEKLLVDGQMKTMLEALMSEKER